jgi:dTDP-4-amino-4,6-dideoxygalactose transaminase
MEEPAMAISGTELACFGGTPEMDRARLTESPLLDKADEDLAARLIRERRIEPVGGQQNAALRSEWALAFNAKHCLPVWSGNAALQVALIGARIGPGDDVLVPDLTFTATASAVLRVGARPIFVDVEPDTFEIDLADAAAKLTSDTRAIIPVHCHGLPCDMDAVLGFALNHAIHVIEDAAQAPGATFQGHPMGTWGLATIYSHSRGKPVQAGGGGQVTTNDDNTFDRMRLFASQGEDRPAHSEPHEHRAYRPLVPECDNMRMTEHNAALVRGQLARLPEYIRTANLNAADLTELFTGVPGLRPPFVPPDRTSAWTYYRVSLDLRELDWDGDPLHARDNIIRALYLEGAPVSTWLLDGRSRQRAFRTNSDGTLRKIDPQDCPITQLVLDTTFVIGAAPYMLHVQHPSDIARVANTVRKVFEPKNIRKVLDDVHHPLPVQAPQGDVRLVCGTAFGTARTPG